VRKQTYAAHKTREPIARTLQRLPKRQEPYLGSWVSEWTRSLDLSSRRYARCLHTVRTKNVKHYIACGDEVIRDNPPVAAPPHCFGAHNDTMLRATEFAKLSKTVAEALAHRVVGIVMKTIVCPKCIHVSGDVALPAAQAAERLQMLMLHIEFREALWQDLAVKLRVGA